MGFHRRYRYIAGGIAAALILSGSVAAGGTPMPTFAAARSAAPLASTATATATATISATASATATMTAKATATTTKAPSASPMATRTVTPTATATPATTSTLSITPTTSNPGGIVTVSGSGFKSNETVFIYFNAESKTVTSAKADTHGALPPTGVTVPASLPTGTQTLTAIGTSSKKTATASINIQKLAPSITLNPTTASPGATVTVTGKGFAAKEQVTLSLNGAALVTAPSAITTTNGALTATFSVPSSILRGSNTVSAVGNQSRVTAVTTLNGNLPVAAQFYFAGGINTSTTHAFIALLNANSQPASVQLTFYFDNGATFVHTLTVQPTANRDISVGSFGLPAGTFGLYVKADRQISAQINMTRDGLDGDNLLGNTGLATRWYLAEGYTGLTFHENISILNPSSTAAAHVTLHLLPFGGRTRRDVAVTVPVHSNTVVDINKALPGQSLSIVADADQPVVVERTLTFSNGGYGLTTRSGTQTPATSWIFAEGTTVNKFQTFLTILNPNATPALVTASFFARTGDPSGNPFGNPLGNPLGSKTLLVQGASRANIKLNDFLSASGIATVLTSNSPIVVERPEYFGSPNAAGIAGSDVFGQNGASMRSSFPGGNTSPGNSEFLLIYNPSIKTIPIDATFYGADGKTITKRVDVPPTIRFNIDVNRLIPGFSGIHGAVLQSTNGQGFVAEQTVFAPNHSFLRSTQGLAQ